MDPDGPNSLDQGGSTASETGRPQFLGARRFWECISRGRVEMAEDAARGIGETPVSAFPFGEAGEGGVGSGDVGALPARVAEGTPKTTIDY